MLLIDADDLKLLGTVSGKSDTELMQKDIKCVEKLCEGNKMNINSAKTNFITFNRKTNYMIGNTINSIQSVKGLGVYFEHNMTFSTHLYAVITDSKRLTGYLFNQW